MQVGARNRRQGGLFGFKLGALLGAASVLGLRAGTTASWTMRLAAWFAGATVMTGGACFMAGLAAERGEKRALLSALCFVAALVVIVLLQSFGLVPARCTG